jgi:hypothetical protein
MPPHRPFRIRRHKVSLTKCETAWQQDEGGISPLGRESCPLSGSRRKGRVGLTEPGVRRSPVKLRYIRAPAEAFLSQGTPLALLDTPGN